MAAQTVSSKSCSLLLGALLAATGVSSALHGAIAAEKRSPMSNGLDIPGMNPSVAPGNDFFAYANGTWIKSTEIPPDRSTYGTSQILVEVTDKRTVELIQEAAKNKSGANAEARKIGEYYASFMDEATIEKKGLAPLQPAFDRIAAIKDRKALSTVLGSMLRADVDALNSTNFYTDNLFGLWVAQDLSDPSRYSPFLLQGGLGMPDRDYYIDSSAHMAELRTKYQAHLANVLKLAKISDAEGKAARIFDLEKRMATVHATRLESIDVQKANNHWTRKEFETRAPGLDWQVYFKAARLDRQNVFTVWHPSAVTGLSALVASQPLETWRDYLTLRVIEHAAPFLPKAFVEERFAFYGKEMSGTPKLRERWKRGVANTNDALGEAVGKLYVEKYFSAAEKARAETMVRNLIAAFGQRIDRLEWMAPETKSKAKAKLAALKVGVGYPDRWRDYSALDVVAGDALGNAARAKRVDYQHSLAKLGQPIDRSEWVMTPQLVNAVNLPVMNAMNFPAAILQPPYFDASRAAAMDYGATGATIGHEISHSFDDQGALFDASGKLQNWWTQEDFAHFQASGEKLAKQYDGYKPFPDLALNGKQVLSENIADLAGLAVAYDAYRLSLQGKPAPVIDGLTGDQQFFVSYAQSWRAKFRDQALRQQVITDGHAPNEYRADTVRNLDAWYTAFTVKPQQALYLAPPERVRVW